MPKIRLSQCSHVTFPSLPIYWRRVLAVSLSDLEAELSLSLHHPLQPERALEALSLHAHLLRRLIYKNGARVQRPCITLSPTSSELATALEVEVETHPEPCFPPRLRWSRGNLPARAHPLAILARPPFPHPAETPPFPGTRFMPPQAPDTVHGIVAPLTPKLLKPERRKPPGLRGTHGGHSALAP